MSIQHIRLKILRRHALEREELLRTLETSTDEGPSSQEAERRLQSIGPNQLEEAKPVTFWQMIWGSSTILWFIC